MNFEKKNCNNVVKGPFHVHLVRSKNWLEKKFNVVRRGKIEVRKYKDSRKSLD